MLSGWNFETSDLPGYAAPPDWWRGPDVELFEIPDSPFAYVVYNVEEIGLAKYAGNVAVFRGKERPVPIFIPNCWYMWPSRGVIRCNREANVLLVYIANAYDPMESHALVDLAARKFAPVFIPFPVASYTFTQLGIRRFAMIPQDGDAAPYHRSFLIEPDTLRWFDYTEDNGFDIVPLPSRLNSSVWQYRDIGWQIVWHRAEEIALEAETPTDAQTVTNRAMKRIDTDNLEEVLDHSVEYQIKPDDGRLRPLIEEERAALHRERKE